MEETNLALHETYITIWQLRFLSRIAKMDKKRLTHQINNFQAIPKGKKCARGIQKTKHREALASTCRSDKNEEGKVTTSKWIDIMNNNRVTRSCVFSNMIETWLSIYGKNVT